MGCNFYTEITESAFSFGEPPFYSYANSAIPRMVSTLSTGWYPACCLALSRKFPFLVVSRRHPSAEERLGDTRGIA